MDRHYTDAEKNSVVRNGAVSEKAVDPVSCELERIRNLAYLIQRDGSATVHVRAYAAEIDQAAHLLETDLQLKRE